MIDEEKSALRARLIRARKDLHAEYRKRAGEKIIGFIARTGAYQRAQSVLFYYPLALEVDIRPLMRDAWASGKTVLLPRCRGEQLALFRYVPGDRLDTGPLKTREPSADGCPADEGKIGCVLTPGLGFDRSGGRIGYGKGYYDRLFARLPGAYRIGVAFEAQILDRVPREEHDCPVDMLVTETGITRVTGKERSEC